MERLETIIERTAEFDEGLAVSLTEALAVLEQVGALIEMEPPGAASAVAGAAAAAAVATTQITSADLLGFVIFGAYTEPLRPEPAASLSETWPGS